MFFYSERKTNVLTKQPYCDFCAEYSKLKGQLNNNKIELTLSGNACERLFKNGFSDDLNYMNNIHLDFFFEEADNVFIRMTLSFDADEDNFSWCQDKVVAIKKRAPYFYIPKSGGVDFSAEFGRKYGFNFDAITAEKNDVEEVCCMLISLVIATFATED